MRGPPRLMPAQWITPFTPSLRSLLSRCDEGRSEFRHQSCHEPLPSRQACTIRTAFATLSSFVTWTLSDESGTCGDVNITSTVQRDGIVLQGTGKGRTQHQ
jgi:hypothetical protein